MGQKPIEIVLLRQLASYLAMPMMIFDVDGNLLFYNEPAEALLGLRFDETGEMPLAEWYRLLNLTDQDRSYLPLESRPLVIARRIERSGSAASTGCHGWSRPPRFPWRDREAVSSGPSWSSGRRARREGHPVGHARLRGGPRPGDGAVRRQYGLRRGEGP
jgi:PAS domain-containing protein